MSAAAVLESVSVQVPLGASVRRPRLVVVAGGRAEGRPAVLSAPCPAVLSVPRWVRLAVTISVVAVAAALLVNVGGAGAASGAAAIGSVEVRPGQTLSEIARAELPGMATAEAVARIQLANNLPSSHVTAGQVIIIPGY